MEFFLANSMTYYNLVVGNCSEVNRIIKEKNTSYKLVFFYTKKHTPLGACLVCKHILALINLVSRCGEILFGIPDFSFLTSFFRELFNLFSYEFPFQD